MTYRTDQKIANALTGEVDRQTAQIAALVIVEDRLASVAAERVDELQRAQRGNGRHVDLVLTADEITNRILASTVGIRAGAKHEDVGTCTTGQAVGTATTVDDVVAGTTLEVVGGSIADQQVIARTAQRVFNHHTLGDRNIAHHATDIRERGGIEVDLLVLGEAGEVEGILAPAIPHREHHLGRGGGGAVEIAPGSGVEPIDRITGTGAHVRAIELLNGSDVIQQRCRRVRRSAALDKVLVSVGLTPVAHDAVATGIFRVSGVLVARIALARVVVTWVRQAKGVADFMGQGLTTVIAIVRGGVDLVAVIDKVPGLAVSTAVAAGQVGKSCPACTAVAVVAEGHMPVAAGSCLGEADLGNVCPGLHRQYCLCFLLRVERTESPQRIVEPGRFGRQERVSEVDGAVAIAIRPGGVVAKNIISGLID